MFITVRDGKLVLESDSDAVLGAFDTPDFAGMWAVLGTQGDDRFLCSSSVDESGNEALRALLDGAFSEWSELVDGEQRTYYLGYVCKVARQESGRWTAWASQLGACRVVSWKDERTFATDREAWASALTLAYEDTYPAQKAA